MFLTRLGFGSKIVVTGDVTQVDLPSGTHSGLRVVEGILDDVEDISFCRLTAHDVVRHRLVGKIVAAYEEFDVPRKTNTASTADADPDAREHPTKPLAALALSRGPRKAMSIEVLNESGEPLDVDHLVGLSRFVLDRMRVHPLAELCIKAVDEDTMAELNEKWMEGEGPTDVLAFPMDELRPGLVNEDPEEGILGDLMLCPSVARAAGGHRRPLDRGRARAAQRARDPAPARLRPRRAGGARGDVRPAGRAPRCLAATSRQGR